METRTLLFPFAFVGAIILLALFVIWVRASRDRQRIKEEAEAERREAAIKDAIERQILLPDGKPACVVCHTTEATETWPVVHTSWLDKVTAFKELYALTPRYEVRDGEGERYELLLCRPHKRMCEQKWKEVIASKRMQVQQLFSQIEADIAQLQGGAMLAWLQAEYEKSNQRLRDFMGGLPLPVPQPQLSAAPPPDDDKPISMPPMSTKVEEQEDEGENRE